jgi:F-type H+-transporting ATPase subunit alpha
VGGAAQTKSMKKTSGTLKLDQAQYRELEAFAKFGSDLDAATKAVLDKGARNVEILKQAQYSPKTVGQQVAIIYLGTNGLLRDVPVDQVRKFEEEFLMKLEADHKDVLDALSAGKYDENLTSTIETVGKEIAKNYKA